MSTENALSRQNPVQLFTPCREDASLVLQDLDHFLESALEGIKENPALAKGAFTAIEIRHAVKEILKQQSQNS